MSTPEPHMSNSKKKSHTLCYIFKSMSPKVFNNVTTYGHLLFWYLSLFVMVKASHQYNEHPRALASLNSPLVCRVLSKVIAGCQRLYVHIDNLCLLHIPLTLGLVWKILYTHDIHPIVITCRQSKGFSCPLQSQINVVRCRQLSYVQNLCSVRKSLTSQFI